MAISRACASRIALCEQLRVLGKGRIAPMSRRRTKCIVGIAGVEARSPTPQVVLHLHLIVPMKEQSRSEPVGTLAPEKHLFLNVRRECLLGTLRGKNPLYQNSQTLTHAARRPTGTSIAKTYGGPMGYRRRARRGRCRG